MNEIELLTSLGDEVQPPDQQTVDRLRGRLLAHIDQAAVAEESRWRAARWPTAAPRAAFAVALDLSLSAVARTRSLGRRWRQWMRSRSHSVMVVFAALVISGSAAAAVVSLNSSRSQPLTGKVPGAIEPASVAGYRYTITVTPNLDAGGAFWNTFIAYTRNHRTGSGSNVGGGGGSPYPTPTNPLFGGNLDQFESGRVGAQGLLGDTVGYTLTGPAVAAVRFGSRTIRTFSSPELPVGDRAAVFFIPQGAPALTLDWRPGQPIRSVVHIPVMPEKTAGLMQVTMLAVLPLDDHGNPIATHATIPPTPFAYYWHAPGAITTGTALPPHPATHPRPGVCQLAQHSLAALRPEWGTVITQVLPAKNAVGELFLSCVSTEYYLHGWPLTVGVLVDARRPGQVLGAIPGARPVAVRPATVNFEAGNLTARRSGNAWLVVQGGSGVAQRLRILGALHISKLDLHH
jgi:hypothetical protein